MRVRESFAALILVGLSAACNPEADAPPNVLFIAVDDLNDWVGVLGGHPQAETPHIDRLAERGLLFTNAHTPAPACNPARTAILTGRWPHSSGIYGNGQPWRAVLPDAVTLPQHFMANGYRALGSGKMFHYPDPASWNEYHPAPDREFFERPRPPEGRLNGIPEVKRSFDWGPIPDGDSEMGDWKTASWVAERLRAPSDEAFFLACGFLTTHMPWYVPAAYFDPYPLQAIQVPKTPTGHHQELPPLTRRIAPGTRHRKVLRHGQWEEAVRAYLASIAFVDRQVGRVLDALDAGPHADDTIVVLWSDHGMHLGEKRHWNKYTLWERATRVPLIVVAPGVTRPGTRSDRPVNLVDLYPTLIDLAGLPERADLDGLSLRPLLEDPEAPWERPSLSTWGRGNHALRTRHWRYIVYHDGSEELYDHRADPNEWENLARRSENARLRHELAGWFPSAEAAEAPFDGKTGKPAAWPSRSGPGPSRGDARREAVR